jgi:hypothetical protein
MQALRARSPEGHVEFAVRLRTPVLRASCPPGITITFVSNLQPGALKRRHEAQRTSRDRRERGRNKRQAEGS